MTLVHDLADVSPGLRPAYWQDAICKSFMSLTCRPIGATPISGQLSLSAFGNVRAARLRCSPHEFRRTREQLDPNVPGSILLDIQVKGANRLRQGDRALSTGRNRGHLYASWESFDNEIVGSGQDAETLVLMVPAEAILRRFPHNAIFRTSPLSFAGALGFALRNLLECAFDDPSAEESEDDLANLYIEALIWFLSAAHQTAFMPSRSTAYRLILRWMEQNLATPLSPSAVAHQFGMSPRTLHRCFAEAGTSFERALLQLRAVRLRNLLSSKDDSRSITSLAHDVGFFDSAHATRTFKTQFGLLPSQYRESYRNLQAIDAPAGAESEKRPEGG
jgi:AraC-like DNA-binding protein